MSENLFNTNIKFINDILKYENLPNIKWTPYYHNFNSSTGTHNGILKELASQLFLSVDDSLMYSNVLLNNNIKIIFNKTKHKKGFKKQ